MIPRPCATGKRGEGRGRGGRCGQLVARARVDQHHKKGHPTARGRGRAALLPERPQRAAETGERKGGQKGGALHVPSRAITWFSLQFLPAVCLRLSVHSLPHSFAQRLNGCALCIMLCTDAVVARTPNARRACGPPHCAIQRPPARPPHPSSSRSCPLGLCRAARMSCGASNNE